MESSYEPVPEGLAALRKRIATHRASGNKRMSAALKRAIVQQLTFGSSMESLARELNVTSSAIYRWKKRYGEAKRPLKAVEQPPPPRVFTVAAPAPEPAAKNVTSPEAVLRFEVSGFSIYERDRSKELSNWYRKLASRHSRKSKNASERLMKLEEIELSEAELAAIAEANAQSDARLDLGQRCDLDAAKSAESLMTGATATVEVDPVVGKVDRDGLPKGSVVKKQFFEDRERVDFSFTVTKLELSVEKLAFETKDGGAKVVSASLDEIGPRKMRVTWEFLANMSILACQYALPLNRFAALASSDAKVFTGGEISRYFRFVATRFSPIYLELGRSLANSAVLLGDDTPSRVVEVNKTLRKVAAKQLTEAELPWADYRNITTALETSSGAHSEHSLGVYLAKHFGFESERKDGRGSKRSLNTTVLSGRTDSYDPKSTVIFYRSHLGSLGNLLDVILHGRDIDNDQLVIQSDLSTTNLISEATLAKRLSLTLAGCAFHARRPFAINEDDDPDLCAAILHSFKGLSIFEGGLDTVGRNAENSAAIRQIDEKEAWEDIRSVAEIMTRKWAKGTPLGDGAHYILRHFERLTYYLSDHRIMPSNNFSERMLRLERLIENGALFRQTLEGRFALDIMRTVIQTAIASRVNPMEYLTWVLRMPEDVVLKAPQEFTPRAFFQSQS